MEKNKLYVLIDKSLEPIYGCVQGGHAVAQWLLEHPNGDWNNDYLIYLSADVKKWKKKLQFMKIDFSEFREPDLGNEITALAIHRNDVLFKHLPIVV